VKHAESFVWGGKKAWAEVGNLRFGSFRLNAYGARGVLINRSGNDGRVLGTGRGGERLWSTVTLVLFKGGGEWEYRGCVGNMGGKGNSCFL